MAALNKDTGFSRSEMSHTGFHRLEAAAVVFVGSLLEVAADGAVSALSGTGSFQGVAIEAGDNTGGADGDIRIQACRECIARNVTVGGSPAIGAAVYSATDNIQDATTVSTGATLIGSCDTLEADGTTWSVRLQALGLRSE